MTNDAKGHRRVAATVDQARKDPASLYDEGYYQNGCSEDGYEEYGRHEPWLSHFGNAAKKIVRRYKPKTAVDVGCAFGLIIEALCDLGVDAYGFDISPFAISNARTDMTDRLRVHSILEPVPLRAGGKKYDLAICIEVLEHLPPEQAETAIANLCAASDRVLFSSSPDDFDEPTHFNVLPTAEWLKMFAAQGFVPGKYKEADYIAKHAFVVEREGLRRGLLGKLFG
jgi:SAM-dependent methyltransferase